MEEELEEVMTEIKKFNIQDTKTIKEAKIDILKEIVDDTKELKEYYKLLKEYRYVDELNELRYGTYMRWVKLNDPKNLVLTRGALFCDTKITEDGVFLVCKNVNSPNHFQIKLDECLLFRKLTDQELVLLAAIDHVSK
jgi:hypothetical protein